MYTALKKKYMYTRPTVGYLESQGLRKPRHVCQADVPPDLVPVESGEGVEVERPRLG